MARLILSPPRKGPFRAHHQPDIVNSLVVGTTQSGKTFLVKYLAEIEARQEGKLRLVFDPKNDPSWRNPAVHTSDQDEFIASYWGSQKCVAVIDEARSTIGLHNEPFIAFATRGSGQGHHNWFITQQVRGLSPTVIGECTELWAFRCGPKNAADLVEDFILPELEGCPNLKKYEFIHLVCWGPDGNRFWERGHLEV